MNYNVKEVSIKFIQNTVAYALPVVFQQFIIYPMIARKLGSEANGLFLSLLALNYFAINVTASVLVNVRMIQHEKYEKEGYKGDYNVMLLCFAAVNILLIVFGSCFYSNGRVSCIDLFLSMIVVLLFLFHDYIYVQYRIELKFNKILVNNVLICAGYIIGLLAIYFVAPYWQFVFIAAYLLTFVYDMFNTTYIREPIKITPFFTDTVKQYFVLMGATLLNITVTYGDRLLLYPLLDGTSVSIFSSAQLIGKMMQMLSTPIASFVLAYLVKEQEIHIRIKLKYIMLGSVTLIALYVGCIIVSYPMIRFLYPAWAEESLEYVGLTAINGIVLMICTIANVFVLKFCNNKYQIIKSTVYLISYLGLSFSLARIIGLWGFCLGNFIASVCQLVFLIYVLLKNRIIEIII